jgi:TPR repeat protein
MRAFFAASALALSLCGTALADDQPSHAAGDPPAMFNAILARAQGGDPRAQHDIGLMYDHGQGVAQDSAQAIKWYELSAQQGDAASELALGYKYYKGQGVTQDYKAAARWYRLAAGQGNAGAQYDLGLMYKQGLGVPQDYTRAYMWFRLASSSGAAAAISNLDFAAQKLSPEQTTRAEAMVTKCRVSSFKDCDN